MAAQILNLLNTAVYAVGVWFSNIMSATGMEFVYVANFVVILSVGILLGPIMGAARSGLSDVAHRRPRKEKSEDK